MKFLLIYFLPRVRKHLWRWLNARKCVMYAISLGERCILNGPLYFDRCAESTICFGDDVVINSNRDSNVIISSPGSMFATLDEGAKIVVGDRVGMSSIRVIASRGVEIGNDTIIGADCLIVDTDFHTRDLENGGWTNDRLASAREVKIGRNCFIGARCTILKGVEVGDGSIVAANSVLTKSVPAGYLARGNPATCIELPENWKLPNVAEVDL